MLSYRHSYHAGNHADVLKHIVLCQILEALKLKEKPFVYIDTHAGAGCYALNAPEATKVGEFKGGIGALWSAPCPESATGYLNTVKQLNPTGALTHYPGSPKIAELLCRPSDRLQLTELHPTDYQRLSQHFQRDRRVKVHRENGYQKLKASVPPSQRRGLVLMDPSYELSSEYEDAVAALIDAHRKWATGIYALWYPVVDRRNVRHLENRLKASGIRKILQLELTVLPDTAERGMTGSGMLIINPPWKLLPEMEAVLPWLLTHLKQSDQSRWLARWLVSE